MNKSQLDAVRVSVSSVLSSLTNEEIREHIMTSYAELRQTVAVPVPA
jgi:hypothetical protein